MFVTNGFDDADKAFGFDDRSRWVLRHNSHRRMEAMEKLCKAARRSETQPCFNGNITESSWTSETVTPRQPLSSLESTERFSGSAARHWRAHHHLQGVSAWPLPFSIDHQPFFRDL